MFAYSRTCRNSIVLTAGHSEVFLPMSRPFAFFLSFYSGVWVMRRLTRRLPFFLAKLTVIYSSTERKKVSRYWYRLGTEGSIVASSLQCMSTCTRQYFL